MIRLEQEIRRLQAENRRLWQEMYKRPIKVKGGGGSSPTSIIQIVGGNTLSDGATPGIEWSNTTLTSVPSLYDPTVDTSFVTGIGRGYLYVDGTNTGLVLIANYSGNGSPTTLAAVQGQNFLGGPTVSLPLVSDPTQGVTLYTLARE